VIDRSVSLELSHDSILLLMQLISKASMPGSVGSGAIRAFSDLVEAIETAGKTVVDRNGTMPDIPVEV
jgi:hypothetical protein